MQLKFGIIFPKSNLKGVLKSRPNGKNSPNLVTLFTRVTSDMQTFNLETKKWKKCEKTSSTQKCRQSPTHSNPRLIKSLSLSLSVYSITSWRGLCS